MKTRSGLGESLVMILGDKKEGRSAFRDLPETTSLKLASVKIQELINPCDLSSCVLRLLLSF